MKVGITPKRCAISLTAVLNSTARSAASRPGAWRMAASRTPGPVSVCKPSRGTRKAARSSKSAVKYGRLCAGRTIEYPNIPGVSGWGEV